MKRHYLGILFICSIMVLVACGSVESKETEMLVEAIERVEGSELDETTETVYSEKSEVMKSLQEKNTNAEIDSDEYTFLIKYNGEYYHYGKAVTLKKPEIELGEITSRVPSGTLPENDMEANGDCIGEMLYTNPDEDAIYMEEESGMEGEPEGMVCYSRYEKGIRKQSYIEYDTMDSYVKYNGIIYGVADGRKKSVPKEFKKAATIQSWGNCFFDNDLNSTSLHLLGGEIYVSEENEDVIYVKSISEVKHEQGIWKCKIEEDY